MPLSEAQKKATAKWQKENMATVGCKLRKEEAEAFKAACSANGVKPNAVLKEFILDYIGNAE